LNDLLGGIIADASIREQIQRHLLKLIPLTRDIPVMLVTVPDGLEQGAIDARRIGRWRLPETPVVPSDRTPLENRRAPNIVVRKEIRADVVHHLVRR
jgi:hypothetical protein